MCFVTWWPFYLRLNVLNIKFSWWGTSVDFVWSWSLLLFHIGWAHLDRLTPVPGLWNLRAVANSPCIQMISSAWQMRLLLCWDIQGVAKKYFIKWIKFDKDEVKHDKYYTNVIVSAYGTSIVVQLVFMPFTLVHRTEIIFWLKWKNVSHTVGFNLGNLTSWRHGNAFCITGPLWRESTSQNRFSLNWTSFGELYYFLCC